MDPQPYALWMDAVDTILAAGGRALLIGGVDTGKTTFCTLIANRAVETGKTLAVVDADIGQSEIGPPACVGWSLVDAPVHGLSELAPAGLQFVGSTAPRGSLLEHVTATRLALDSAAATKPHLTLIDTTGYIHGDAARRLKQAKMALLAPNHVVALQRKDECESLLAALRNRDHIWIHRLPVPPVVTRKSPAFRSQRRASRFARAFEGADMRYYSFETVSLTGTWLGGGASVAPHLLKFIANALRLRAFHAEDRDRHLGIITNGPPVGESGLALIQEQFRAQSITVTPAASLRHLLVGLADHNDRMLGLGLIEAVDFRRQELGILTSIRAHAAAKIIHFGLLRLDSSGKELGTIRPGDV
jgi:polynucleotide 5'-hydroxyl-kinase GRC3/NOL9